MSSRIGLALWRQALVDVCAKTGTRTLAQPFTAWFQTPHICTQWFLSSCRKRLYRKYSPSSYLEYHPTSSRTGLHAIYNAQFHITSLPSNSEMVEVSPFSHNRVRIQSIIILSPQSAPILQFQQNKLHTSTPSLHSLLRFSIFPNDGKDIAQAICQGSAVAVTDASIFSSTIAAAAWVIQCTSTSKRCEGRVRALNGSSKMNSYRAEVFGIYTILIATHQLCGLYNIRQGSMVIACDNDDGLLHSLIFERRIPIRFKSFDLLWAIHSLLQKLPITVTPTKVEGHTDRLGRNKTLLEQLNIEMDSKAKSFCRYMNEMQISQPILHDNPNWSLSIDGIPATERLDEVIKDHIHTQSLFLHLLEKGQITSAGIPLIDWDVLGSAHQTLPHSRYLWLVKYAAGFLPTANHMARHGGWDTNLCPLCKLQIENSQYLMCCSCPDATLERHTKIYDLHQ